ncbi:MAG: hypothetical protein GY862_10285 [Gammaproteobacteria bacterium]|nr:hypothetical protein [Gammaproteobacteria bacterium]
MQREAHSRDMLRRAPARVQGFAGSGAPRCLASGSLEMKGCSAERITGTCRAERRHERERTWKIIDIR